MVAQHLALVMQVDDPPERHQRRCEIERMVDQGPPAHLDHRLGALGGERPHAAAKAGGKDHDGAGHPVRAHVAVSSGAGMAAAWGARSDRAGWRRSARIWPQTRGISVRYRVLPSRRASRAKMPRMRRLQPQHRAGGGDGLRVAPRPGGEARDHLLAQAFRHIAAGVAQKRDQIVFGRRAERVLKIEQADPVGARAFGPPDQVLGVVVPERQHRSLGRVPLQRIAQARLQRREVEGGGVPFAKGGDHLRAHLRRQPRQPVRRRRGLQRRRRRGGQGGAWGAAP